MPPTHPRYLPATLKSLTLALTTAAVLATAPALVLGQAGARESQGEAGRLRDQQAVPEPRRQIVRQAVRDREPRGVRPPRGDRQALGLKPGMAVADIGAGTGLFTRLFADRVGKEGMVYAVDISRPFLKHIAEESKRLGQTQVKTVVGTQTSTELSRPTRSTWRFCATSTITSRSPRSRLPRSTRLRPGGQLVVIDFDRAKGKEGSFVKKHIRADKAVFVREIESAGFAPVEDPGIPALKENFVLRFRKGDASEK